MDLKDLRGKLDTNSSTNLDYRTFGLWGNIPKQNLTDKEYKERRSLYHKIHEHTESLIRELAKGLHEKLKETYGMDTNKYRVRLIVTSGSRDTEYAKQYLHNASDSSSHPYGIAFDLSFKFDILDLSTKRSYTISKDNALHKSIFSALSQIILKKQNMDWEEYNGELFAIIEWNPPHIHITDKLWKGWKPPFYR
jgi:hypothetical protein